MSEEVSEKEVKKILPTLRKLVWSVGNSRQWLEDLGIHVVPCNFYSTTPTRQEIKNSFEYNSVEAPFANPEVFSMPLMQATLEKLIPYAEEFNPPLEGDEEACTAYFWGNSQFSYCDAMSYYSFVRLLKPAQILEIGSGFSTLVAVEALKRNGTGALDCIEPYPRNFLQNNPDLNLHQKPAQAIDADFLNEKLNDGDILFIDSTHTVKNGSDCVHIYLRLLPQIKKNIYVHVHDVFLPYAYPQTWLTEKLIFWTEPYLLYAFLLDNAKAEVIYGSSHNLHKFPDLMNRFMAGKKEPGGGSLWFKYNGRESL